ncbi:hypothetical protein OG625_17595 [Streptomyces sp. NBC_01351]|uniref:hypothetical protein n=1 Tax=Streptomyces sp. NBC_01351 TaxID=2903833 RepID=UPI002E350BA3|nr:hypothetical protein [Streptomyces sp. NBC_01351]
MRVAEQSGGVIALVDEARRLDQAPELTTEDAVVTSSPLVPGEEWAGGWVSDTLERLASDFVLDNTYREQHLSLTASENYPSKLVRMLGSGLQGGFYEFAPPYPSAPGEWAFPDSGAMASLVSKLTGIGKQLFEAASFDWRPNGGSVAEQAVLLGTCGRGDGYVHFAHKDGGHFALESLATVAGINTYHLPMVDRTLLIDVDRLATLVAEHPEIKLVLLDQSFKLRWQPLAQIRAALPEGVFLAYDASHDGALIAGGALPQPTLLGADAVHGNTHKTIPGPQKAYIAFRDADHPKLKSVSDWVCPQMQSNSHAELIAPMYVALSEMSLYGHDYARQILANAKALAGALHEEGVRVSGESFGFTETHQVHIITGSASDALRLALGDLALAGIRTTNIEVPGSNGLHGLRLGVQAMTRRGLDEAAMREVARLVAKVVLRRADPAAIRAEVADLLQHHSLDRLAYSFDPYVESPAAQALLAEVLR